MTTPDLRWWTEVPADLATRTTLEREGLRVPKDATPAAWFATTTRSFFPTRTSPSPPTNRSASSTLESREGSARGTLNKLPSLFLTTSRYPSG